MSRIIDLMIVGAPKSGTTSILRSLGQHPQISIHKQAEFGYFANDNEFKDGWGNAQMRYFGKDTDMKDKVVAKHVKLMYSFTATQRLYEHNNMINVVVVLRNPINRAYSNYWYARARGLERLPTFEQAIEAEMQNSTQSMAGGQQRGYLRFSAYHDAISHLFQVFGREKVRVLLTEDLKENAPAVYTSLLDLLELPTLNTDALSVKHNSASAPKDKGLSNLMGNLFFERQSPIKRLVKVLIPPKLRDTLIKFYFSWNRKPFEAPPMANKTRETLVAYFKNENLKLATLLGRELDFWNQ